MLWFLLLPIALFVALWWCGQWIWTILFWIQLGDDASSEVYGRATSAVVALLVAVVVFVRLAVGRADHRFRWVCAFGTAILAALFVSMAGFDFVSRIEGWSAQDAAENYLAKFRDDNNPFIDPNAARRVIEDIPLDSEHGPARVRRFVLYYGDSPIREVNVASYGWWWWTLASSRPAIPFDLDRAVDHWETDPEEATEGLQEVITTYPNSDAAQWASDTLEGLRKNGRSDTPTWQSEMMRRLRENAKNRRRQQGLALTGSVYFQKVHVVSCCMLTRLRPERMPRR